MGVWNKLFGKDKAKKTVATPARPPRPAETKESLKERIDFLWESVEKLRWSDSDCEKKVLIYTELLGLLDVNSASHDVCAILRNRALSYKWLKKYDAAVQDLIRELEICQKHDHWEIIGECQNLLEDTRQEKRKTEIEAGGGEKAARISYMEEQVHRLRANEPEADTAFESLFADLENDDPDIRNEASRLLGTAPNAIKRLRSIYQNCVITDPNRANLAGRVLGRRIAKGLDGPVFPIVVNMFYGDLVASFITSTCVYCGHLNKGIPAPPNAPFVPYYHSENYKGAYAVQVLCDKCGKEFFVYWDMDPV